MYKKIVSLLLVAVFVLAFAGCGSESTEEAPAPSASASEEQEPAAEPEPESEPVASTPKTVDAVADVLGLTDKGEVYFSMIGATDGAEFNGGAVEVYIFDESSEEYQAAVDGTGMIKAAAYKDGVVLSFPEGTEPDQALIDAFNGIVFE